MSPLPPEPPRHDRSSWLPLALALGLTLLFFHRAVFSAEVFFLRDVQRVYVPLWDYWRARVAAGEFPQWYPYDGLGESYVGMVISGAFHPAHLLSLVLPGAQGLKWVVLLCFPVAFLGMSALGRRLGLGARPALLAALLYTFSGYLVGITNNPLYLLAAVTVPWVLWALEGFLAVPSVGRATGAAVLLALVLFSGDVQGYAVCLGGVLLWSLCRPGSAGLLRSVGGALGVVGLAVLVSAVQIVPTVEGLGEVRAAGQTLDEAMVWSVHPVRLWELLLGPLFAGGSGEPVQVAISQRLLSTGRNNLWVDSFFLGAPALLLAGVALVSTGLRPRTWVFAAATFTVLLLALGKHTFLYGQVFEWVPPWRAFRYPEKLMPFVTFALALAAGAGLGRLERAPRVSRGVWGSALVLGVLVLGAGALEWNTQGLSTPGLAGLWTGTPRPEAAARISARVVLGCGVAGGSLLLLGVLLARVRSPDARAGLLGGLCLAGLFWANGGLYKVGDASLFDVPSPFASRIERDSQESRARGEPLPRVFRLPGSTAPPASSPLPSAEETYALALDAALEPLTPALVGLESATVYLPAVSRRVITLWDEQRAWFLRTAALFNTRYFVISREFAAQVARDGRHRVVERLEGFGLLLLEQPDALPRVYLAHPRCVTNGVEAGLQLWKLQAPREVVVECWRALPEPPLDAPRGEVLAARFAPERVEVEVDARGGEVLVLNDAFYSGWRARVDGKPVDILPANGAVRAVAVPTGVHQVVFTYQMPGLVTGAAVSLGTLLALLGVGFVRRARADAR